MLIDLVRLSDNMGAESSAVVIPHLINPSLSQTNLREKLKSSTDTSSTQVK